MKLARVGILAASLVAGLGAAFIWRELSPTTSSPRPADDCALADKAYPFVSLLGKHDRIVDMRLKYMPFIRTGPASTTFKQGRQIGDLATVAISGPDRASEDAYARSLRYDVGKFPLVPLSGPVVAHNAGPLEYYETHLAFSDLSGAAAFLRIIRASGPTGSEDRLQPVRVGDDSVGWITGNGGSVDKEVGDYLVASSGRDILQFALKGGTSTKFSDLDHLASLAITSVKGSCGGKLN